MGVGAGRDKLAYGLKETLAAFEDTRDDWADDVRRDFDEHDWEPLAQQIRRTLQAMDRLSVVLHQMRAECS